MILKKRFKNMRSAFSRSTTEDVIFRVSPAAVISLAFACYLRGRASKNENVLPIPNLLGTAAILTSGLVGGATGFACVSVLTRQHAVLFKFAAHNKGSLTCASLIPPSCMIAYRIGENK